MSPNALVMDATRSILWDNAHLSQAVFYMFGLPLGSCDYSIPAEIREGTKTRVDTNTTLAGMLPTHQRLVIEDWWCVIFENGVALSVFETDIYNRVCVRMEIGCRIEAEAMAWDIADPRCVLAGVREADFADHEERMRLLKKQPGLKREFVERLELAGSQPFNVSVETSKVDKDLSIRVGLEGILLRPVQ